AAEYQGRRDRVLERLRGIPGVTPLVPEGGLFVMVDVRGLGLPSDEVRRFLLREAGVVVIHGAAYGSGGEGTLRVCFAAGAETVSGEVRFDRLSRALYSTDASVYQIVPLGVVIPKSEADIVATVKACARFRVPLTARGGGTSQAGQAIGPGLQLDCSKYLNRILEINAADRWARVQPGCVLDELNLALKPHGLHFPIDISTSNRATLGGMIANNSSGTRSVIYGKTIDHVAELRVLLADGSEAHLGPLSPAEWQAKSGEQTLEG